MLRFRENWIALTTILRREITRFLRIWTQTLLPPMITMALYFIIFGELIGARIGKMEEVRYIDYIVPGLIMMSIITNSFGNVVASFFSAKFQKNIEEMLVSPMPSTIILWGFVLGGVARGLVVGVLVTIISVFFTNFQIHEFGITLLFAILTALLFSLAGLINAIFAKKFDDTNIVLIFILTPLTYLGGVFYSIDLLPSLLKWITYINPIFYMVNAFRYGMLGRSDVSISTAFIVTAGLIILFYVFSLWLLKRGVGIRT